jgi:hypothetical protein
MTTDNICFYLQNTIIQTSQTGGQWYFDTSPLVFLDLAMRWKIIKIVSFLTCLNHRPLWFEGLSFMPKLCLGRALAGPWQGLGRALAGPWQGLGRALKGSYWLVVNTCLLIPKYLWFDVICERALNNFLHQNCE